MLTKYKFNSYYYKIDFRRQTISLMEVVTKCNCLLKYLRVFGGGYFIYGTGQKDTRLSKLFYEDGPLKRYAYENRGYFQRWTSKEACLRKHARGPRRLLPMFLYMQSVRVWSSSFSLTHPALPHLLAAA